MKHGFIKVAAASPVIKLADAYYNAQRTIECIKAAEKKAEKEAEVPEEPAEIEAPAEETKE